MKHKVPRPRSRTHCLWLELLSSLVEVDLLLSEPERLSISERDQFHAQSRRVKSDGCVDAGYGENEVVKMIDNKSHTHTLIGWWQAASSPCPGTTMPIAVAWTNAYGFKERHNRGPWQSHESSRKSSEMWAHFRRSMVRTEFVVEQICGRTEGQREPPDPSKGSSARTG